ncbi:hypothetical protein WMY93_006900 [Mugilogobius chulae]|uniref:HMG box domain-containing protein n=1 Tax=Mugilogobius chulae TaxID=88201 RepID=A0AAW0PLV3_9GOBI
MSPPAATLSPLTAVSLSLMPSTHAWPWPAAGAQFTMAGEKLTGPVSERKNSSSPAVIMSPMPHHKVNILPTAQGPARALALPPAHLQYTSASSNKVPVVQPSHAVHPLTPLITYSDEHFAPGPHSGHHQDANNKGMPRHHPGPDMPNFYSLSPGGVGQITPPLGWFSHHMVPGPPGPQATGIPHPAIVNPQIKHEPPHETDLMHMKSQHDQRKEQEPKRPHIKKPLNAFMLYMKEMRANVVAECTLKESAAINQILGRRWHALSREEQAKYYELARKERQLHMQLYPGWSARDNYGKKKKRKREKMQETATGGKRNNFSTCKAKAAAPGPLLEMEAC